MRRDQETIRRGEEDGALKTEELASENKATHQGYRVQAVATVLKRNSKLLTRYNGETSLVRRVLRVRCCNGTERCCGHRTRTGSQSLLRAKVLSLKNSLLEDWTRTLGTGRLFGR